MPTFPTPPPDAAGGFFVMDYTNGIDAHRMKVHVAPFNSAAIASPYNYPYNPAIAGGETGIIDTVTNLAAKVSAAYDAAWSFSLQGLWQIVAGVPVPIFPTPVWAGASGPGATGTTGIARATEFVFNFKTALGGRARLVLIGVGGSAPGAPTEEHPVIAGTTVEQIVYYCTQAHTGMRAHDGQVLLPVVTKVTRPYNRRLRRHYNLA